MADARRGLGQRGEELAATALKKEGYVVLERNWRGKHGEIDIIANDGDTLAIVEVRTRSSHAFGTPEESITQVKQQRLVALGQQYVEKINWSGPWRIDVVAVMIRRGGNLERITILKNAVGD